MPINDVINKDKKNNHTPPPPLQRLRGPPYGEDRG